MNLVYLLSQGGREGLEIPDVGRFSGNLLYIPDVLLAFSEVGMVPNTDGFGEVYGDSTAFLDESSDVDSYTGFLGHDSRQIGRALAPFEWRIDTSYMIPNDAFRSYLVAREMGHNILEYWQLQKRGINVNLVDFVYSVLKDVEVRG